MDNLSLKQANNDDLSLIRDLLKRNYLVFRDIKNKNVELFWAYEDSAHVGIIGLEKHDGIGLLRSLVVIQDYRNKGYGRKICNSLIEHAKSLGIDELYLLTQTARKFFEKIGFSVVKRKDVPIQIRNTAEFSSLCPESAICMKLDLQ